MKSKIEASSVDKIGNEKLHSCYELVHFHAAMEEKCAKNRVGVNKAVAPSDKLQTRTPSSCCLLNANVQLYSL